MDNKEAREFIKNIADAYPNFEPTPSRVKMWAEYMEGVPFDRAMKQLKKHISNSKSPPTISEILESEKFVDLYGNPL